MTDAQLIEASRRGDRAAFGELVERCARMVSGVAYAATRDRALSEDLTQDTFVVAWCDLERLRDPSALRPWLCRIARNLAHKARRHRERELVVETLELAAPEADHSDRVVAAALQSVPDVYREALVLFYYEQRSVKDVAAALGISENVVHKRLSRGRRCLAAGVEDLVEDTLERRRSRRDLALYVLAALPVTKGLNRMWKLGALGIAAATLAGGTVAWSGAPAPVEHPAKVAPRPATRRVAPQLPPAMHVANPITCLIAARHIVAISQVGEVSDADHASDAERVARHLEQQCKDDPAVDLDCVMAADEMSQVRGCMSPDPDIVAVAPVTTTTCDVLGPHVAALMLASMTGVAQDNVRASVLVNADDLQKRVIETCADWSEPLRHCFAAATRFDQIVACKRR